MIADGFTVVVFVLLFAACLGDITEEYYDIKNLLASRDVN